MEVGSSDFKLQVLKRTEIRPGSVMGRVNMN